VEIPPEAGGYGFTVGLSGVEIAAVVEEIRPAVVGGWIQKIHQPGPRTITLEIRGAGRTLFLLLSADAETARLHVLARRYPNPPSPPPFCQFLRAHLQSARIDGLEQMSGDRIVRLGLTVRSGPCALIAELTGRRSNLIVVSGEETVLAALDAERAPVGRTYQPPAARIAHEEGPEVPSPGPLDHGERFPISSALERRYREREEALVRTRAQQARVSELKSRIKKTARRADALRGDIEKARRYRDYDRYGELLKVNLHAMGKGDDRITVIDYFDPEVPELIIPLDPARTPQANMEDYFKKHRKYVAAEREIAPRLDATERELHVLQAERSRIEQGSWEPEAKAPGNPARPLSPHTGRQKRLGDRRAGPFRRFISSDGLPIYVGRNASENELLTFGEGRPDDLWLHAHGTPGSHVLVRLDKGVEPPYETLRDAATLAVLYSDLKKSGKGEVIYTRRKYVRKLKGKPPGTVTVTNEKTLFVALDRPRLDRMKERST
jgi:predicted ribosome quality control (RQC) complex YloA/Tae2 family protein